MNEQDLAALNGFIVRAKAATYVGSGAAVQSCRLGSHDLRYEEGEWAYLDSYFGGSDFIGEEVVWRQGKPAWAMNYYGYILAPGLITAAEAGQMIKASLSLLYKEGRFLGGFQHRTGEFAYFDTNEGDASRFSGREWIERGGVKVYELVYHGGLIKE